MLFCFKDLLISKSGVWVNIWYGEKIDIFGVSRFDLNFFSIFLLNNFG